MPEDKTYDKVLAVIAVFGLAFNSAVAMGISADTMPTWFTATIGTIGIISLACLIMRDIRE